MEKVDFEIYIWVINKIIVGFRVKIIPSFPNILSLGNGLSLRRIHKVCNTNKQKAYFM